MSAQSTHLAATPYWPPQLILDLAMGIDSPEFIAQRHGLSLGQLDTLYTIPAFKHELMSTMKEVSESGVTFRAKAAVQAESYLLDMDTLMQSPDVGAPTKVDIFKTLAKYGDLEPKQNKVADDSQKQAINIQINF